MSTAIPPELREAFSHGVYSSSSHINATREENDQRADAMGLICVRQMLLEKMARARVRKPEPEKFRQKPGGPSWPFAQVASYPIGVNYRGDFWGAIT